MWRDGCFGDGVCLRRTAAGRSSAAALWTNSGTSYAAAARCWWRNCRAMHLRNPAAPSKNRWLRDYASPRCDINDICIFSPPPLNSMKRAASLNYLNKTSDDTFQVRRRRHIFNAVLRAYPVYICAFFRSFPSSVFVLCLLCLRQTRGGKNFRESRGLSSSTVELYTGNWSSGGPGGNSLGFPSQTFASSWLICLSPCDHQQHYKRVSGDHTPFPWPFTPLLLRF